LSHPSGRIEALAMRNEASSRNIEASSRSSGCRQVIETSSKGIEDIGRKIET
jgi:hypothetical protein